jgi:hypothetical protein
MTSEFFAAERNLGQNILDFRTLGQDMSDFFRLKIFGAPDSKELTAARICLIGPNYS